eukprot:CAMPEP_0118668902 /NCGR_PEP_ID=MMETSP0785-20121206/20602_1 /TAXON_ID=91992 /ORGANISM="Bolidomonas pacifica, Strain CCMP 1866" /LENGTH=535 /DNA_ID=CAMNT_0006563523 /DNA_START=149 /DNA_END=1753 /DNA_ORIENTATION=+
MEQMPHQIIKFIKLILLLATTVTSSMIDPTTPKHDPPLPNYKLVMSDEFTEDSRDFADGQDNVWTAMDKNDYTNSALHYYKPKAVTTKDGKLKIRTFKETTSFPAEDVKTSKISSKNKYYTSGMIQSWNKFCFTGGIVSIRARLPGNAFVGGLWPASWMMGNLARATYVGSSDYMWPWSYDKCNRENQNGQELSGCNEGYHWDVGKGRGAPEIDIIEGMGATELKITTPYVSTSLQVSPGVKDGRPVLGSKPVKGRWYEGMEYGVNSTLNNFFYGVLLEHKPKSYSYQSDAISANTQLGETHFEEFHDYTVVWSLDEEGGNNGSLEWYMDGNFLYRIKSPSLNITGSKMPDEPMYLILNTAISSTWGFPAPIPDGCECESYSCEDPKCKCAFSPGFCENLPAVFEIDHVRVYQREGETLGCSTKDRPTKLFIEGHKERYMKEGDVSPLKPIAVGGGSCTYNLSGDVSNPSSTTCGVGGTCDKGYCACKEGWVGSMCRNREKSYDEEVWRDPGNVEEIEVKGPSGVHKSLLLMLLL